MQNTMERSPQGQSVKSLGDATFRATVALQELNVTLGFLLCPYHVELATAFGTSHSSTETRTNALLFISIDGSVSGFGEAGLPPKKSLVYEADLRDCTDYCKGYIEVLSNEEQRKKARSGSEKYNPFRGLPERNFSEIRGPEGTSYSPVHHAMLCALDICPLNGEAYGRAGKALVESAILDSYGKEKEKTIVSLLNINSESNLHKSFYTAAINENIDLIVKAAKFGAQHTPHLKIKLNHSIDLAKTILHRINEALPASEGEGCSLWSLDANCAWTPEISTTMCKEVLYMYKDRIFMVEQPFPVGFNADVNNEKWVAAKKCFNGLGLKIFADESMRTWMDIESLVPYVDGVNIKMEKCGGYRGALRAVSVANQYNLDVWFGCMVGSNLNSTATAHLFCLACCSDLDGALLVKESSKIFSGGFLFTESGTIRLPQGNGVGLQIREDIADDIKKMAMGSTR